MFSVGWISQNLNEDGHEISKKRSSLAGSNKFSFSEGLRILIHLSEDDSNVLFKSSLKSSKPFFQKKKSPSGPHDFCFLKSCFLCNKNLSPAKDVYMYRGDQGFCSIECRNRQIYLDDIKQREASSKKLLSSLKYSRTGGRRCETGILLEEFRKRQRPLSYHKNSVFIVS